MNILGILSHHIFLGLTSYLTGILFLMLAILILLANPRSRSHRFIFAFNLSVFIWGISMGTIFLAPPPPWDIWNARFQTFTVVVLSLLYTHQVLVIVKKDASKKTLLIVDYALGAILGVLSLTSPQIVKGLSAKLGFPSFTDGGPFYFVIPLYLFLNLIYSIYLVLKRRQEIPSYRKKELSWFLIATIVGFGSGTPGFLGVMNIPIPPLTMPLVAAYPMILIYAIVKHRFLDIERLVKNTLRFAILLIPILALGLFLLVQLKKILVSPRFGFSEILAQAVVFSLAIISYRPLKNTLSRLTQHLFYQHSSNPETIFRKLAEDMLRYLDTKELIHEVTKRIAEILGLEHLGFYLRSKKTPYAFTLEEGIGRVKKKFIHQSKQLIQYLERTNDVLTTPYAPEECRFLLQTKKPYFALAHLKDIKYAAALELGRLGGIAAFPIFEKQSLAAILIIGPKKSDAPWQAEEFHILKSFTRYISLALKNAAYAEEIRLSREQISLSERDASAGTLISGVEHEVKGSLSTISINIGKLRRQLADPRFLSCSRENVRKRVTEDMQSVRLEVRKIDTIISHLSDIADEKPLVLEEDLKPYQVAEKVLQRIANNGQCKNIRIHNNIPKNLSIACDPSALYEILDNLIRNSDQAMTDQGEIVIEFSLSNEESVIRIKDSGSGISSEHLPFIFEPFFTTKRKKHSGVQGSGMGLFIVKELMRRMGGDVEVTSRPGQGSEFSLHFPSFQATSRRAA